MSEQVAVSVIGLPSPVDVLLVVQASGSMPDPPALSVQCQLTVTSVLFQPAPFFGGDCAGAAVGGVVSHWRPHPEMERLALWLSEIVSLEKSTVWLSAYGIPQRSLL